MRFAIVNLENGIVEDVVIASDAFTPPEGVLAIPSETAWPGWQWTGSALVAPVEMITSDQVNAERDRRVAAGFAFKGKVIQCDPASKDKILGAVVLSMRAQAAGVQPGNLRWHGGATDFIWITADNSVVTLDAFEVAAMGEAAAAWDSAHVFAARAIKALSPIPADFAADVRWPARA